LNSVADSALDDPEAALLTITRRINGGLNGLADRRRRQQRCWRVLGQGAPVADPFPLT